MIIHNVFFRFRDDTSLADIDYLSSNLTSMIERIEVIKKSRWMSNTSKEKRDQGFKYAIRMEFESQFDLEKYLSHPHHIEVCNNYLFPLLHDIDNGLFVFDYKE